MSAASALRRIEQGARTLPRKWVEASIKDIRKVATKRLNADTGGDASLSNAPGKIRITSKIDGTSVVTGVIGPAKRSMGIYTWLEDGTKPHKNAGAYPGTQHPGTAGKGTWTKAVDPEIKRIERDLAKRFEELMR